MEKRFVSIWFRYLSTDWFSLRQPELKNKPFVLKKADHGRMIISEANAKAEANGIFKDMVLADARAILRDLEVSDDVVDLPEKLLRKLGEWCIRFTPVVSIDAPDGLLLDVTGCPHLWGGEQLYLDHIHKKLTDRGYDVRVSMAGTPGVAWAVARYGKELIIPNGKETEALYNLPPESLRIDAAICERLHKLGLHHIRNFIHISRPTLRRRFGQQFLTQLDKALGVEFDIIEPLQPMEPYEERLPCLDPIVTAPGIEIALLELLKKLCYRLQQEQKGLRCASLKAFRVDGKIQQIEISTNKSTHHVNHIFKLFELKIPSIEPGLGIELFSLQASRVEDHFSQQGRMWETNGGLVDERLTELLDRLSGKLGMDCIHRYLPDEHYWPERSFKTASSLEENPETSWPAERLRPLRLLRIPEKVEVTAPIPDYPPMLFRYKGKIHKIIKADGPERIEQEWWISNGQHRDYYQVEDEEGLRYWIFRLGHYDDKHFQWYLHGFFA